MLVAASLLLLAAVSSGEHSNGKAISILLASCNNPNMSHYPAPSSLASSLYRTAAAHNSSGFVWAGDAVYGDAHEFTWSYRGLKHKRILATPARFDEFYGRVLSSPYYPLPSAYHFGTIDDHDLGVNNGDKRFPLGQDGSAGRAFMEFLDASNSGRKIQHPATDLYRIRSTSGAGVYTVKVFTPTGIFHESTESRGVFPGLGQGTPAEKVAVFVIDCRSKKDPWPQGFDWDRTAGKELDFLGEEQWAWLESMLSQSDAAVNVIVNGL